MGPRKSTGERKARAHTPAVYIQILDERRADPRAKPEYLLDWLDGRPSWVASVQSGVAGHEEVLRDWRDYRAAGGLVPRPRASERTRRLFRRAPTVRGCGDNGWVADRTPQAVDDPAVYVDDENVFVPKSRLTTAVWRDATANSDAPFRLPPHLRCPPDRAVERENESAAEPRERERNLRVESKKMAAAAAARRLVQEKERARMRTAAESKTELAAAAQRMAAAKEKEEAEEAEATERGRRAELREVREEREERELRPEAEAETEAEAHRTEGKLREAAERKEREQIIPASERKSTDTETGVPTVPSTVLCKGTEQFPRMWLGTFTSHEFLYHGSPVGFAPPYLPRGLDPRFTTNLKMATYYATKSSDKERAGKGFVYEYKLIKPIPNVVHVCGTWSRLSGEYLDFLYDNGVPATRASFTEDETGKRVWNRIAGDADLLQSCRLWSGVWVPGYESQLFMCGHLVPAYFALSAVYAVTRDGTKQRIDPHTNKAYISKIETDVVVRNYGFGERP